MKLQYHIIYVTLNKEETLIINALNGLMDIIDTKSLNLMKEWGKQESIIPLTDFEEKFFNSLKERSYLVSSSEEEENKKRDILSCLKENYLNNKNKFSVLGFVLTYRCNFRCPYCYEENEKDGMDILTHEMVDTAFSFASDETENILLFGGEPLLPETMDIVDYIIKKSSGKKVTIITNGFYLQDYISILSQASIDYVQVTLDGDKEFHDKRRYLSDGGPTFDRIMGGIRSCLENDIPVRIRMNVDVENFERTLSFQDYILDLFKNYDNLVSTEIAPIFQLKNPQRQAIYKELYQKNILADNYDRGSLNKVIAPNRPIITAFLEGETASPLYSFCYSHGKTMFFDPLGDLYSCILSVGKRELTIGSYHPYKSFKTDSIYTRTVEKMSECLGCKYTFICGGGCPMQLNEYSDMMRPVCNRVVQDIHTFIPEIYKAKCKNG